MAFTLAAGTLGVAAPASAACQFQKIVEVPVTMDGLRPTITAKINGQDAKFLVDTGAFFGAVSPDTAAKYNMKRTVAPFGLTLEAVGGAKHDAQAVEAQNFTFAGVGFRNTQFLLVGRVGEAGLAGNIGENLMGPFDVEYDFANGMMRYFKATGCGREANLAYWSQGMALSRLSIIEPTDILLKVVTSAKVEGHAIRVQFDSGSWLSVLNRNAAARAGIRVSSEGVANGGIAYGLYGKGMETFLAPFASFQIGGEEIKNTRLRVSDIDLSDADMLLGADFFLSHRILISNSQKKVYFTYNGGPVFRLDRTPQPQQAQASAAPPPGSGASTPSADAPKTAAEYARRASALAARREYQPAIADDSRAIELEPDNAGHYRARAMARLGNGQPVLAMADLDQALKYKPNDLQSLMARGELYLATKDAARAQADFEAAMKLAPEDRSLTLRTATAYMRAENYEAAIRQYDIWLAAHPKGDGTAQVIAERCNARATWGKQLDIALADCDAALKLGGRTSDVMENRGVVLLRMGRIDDAISQFDGAIHLQPKLPWSLYGRGLAKLKKGDKAGGEADIAAAVALRPGLPEEARRYGLISAGEGLVSQPGA
ncbi:MAG: aspartyl protease family protein [Caulobacterales bacterium]